MAGFVNAKDLGTKDSHFSHGVLACRVLGSHLLAGTGVDSEDQAKDQQPWRTKFRSLDDWSPLAVLNGIHPTAIDD